MAKKAASSGTAATDSKKISPAIKRGRGRPAGQPVKPRRAVGKNVLTRPKFHSYIYRVMKQVAPTAKISTNCIGILNSFVNDLFEKIAREAGSVTRYSERSILRGHEVQAAVRLVIPGELGKHAVQEGTKAVVKLGM